MEHYKEMWTGQPNDTLVKFLYIIDNGDINIYSKALTSKKRNEENAKKTLETFSKILSSEDRKSYIQLIKQQLEDRAKRLMDHQIILLPELNDMEEIPILADDQDLLNFVSGCLHFGIPCHKLLPQYQKIKNKIEVENAVRPEFFIPAENIRTIKICNELSPSVVFNIWKKLEENEYFKKTHMIQSLDESIMSDLINIPGLKDVLFLYIVRYLELNNQLNRIYTHHLEFILNKVLSELSSEQQMDIKSIENVLDLLDTYPISDNLPGFCAILCVTHKRDGAENEVMNIQKTYEGLGFNVKPIPNPKKEDVDELLKDLERVRFGFYSSFTLWISAHGDEKSITLADGTKCLISDLIGKFSSIDNFKKKPKLFFINACRGKDDITLGNQGKFKYYIKSYFAFFKLLKLVA